MVGLWFLGFLLLTACKADDVKDLTDSSFDDGIQSGTTLVMFYAPWCGHCKRLKPEFEKAASVLKKNDPPVVLAKVDCTDAGKSTCERFSVSGYPTLKIFKGGDLADDYNGPRESAGIVKFMKSQVGPASKPITSSDDMDRVLSQLEVVVVAFAAEDSELLKTFLKLADVLRNDVNLAHTSDPELMKKYGEGVVTLFRPKHLHTKLEESTVDVTADSVSDMQKLIKQHYHGLVGHRTNDNVKDFSGMNVVAYYNVDYKKDPKGTNYWRNRVMKVAMKTKGEIKFAVSKLDDFQHEIEEFGVGYTPKEKQPIVLARDAKNNKYIMSEEFSVDNLQSFVNDLLEGKLTPYLKSEEVPESNDGPVKVAVARNFDEVVSDDKDTLIEFYAPWCGHCKKLAPIYDELGEKMKDESGVTIAKMDATANDVPSGFEVRGFPTIFFVPKGRKQSPVTYQGGREVDDFVKYLAKHASDELSGYDRNGKAKKSEL